MWFAERFLDEPTPALWRDLDHDADFDAEMTIAETWTTAELFDRFEWAVSISNDRISKAPDLDALSVQTNGDGEQWSLRWILVHMIEEYARHCGHADFIRESLDGDTLS